MSAYRIRFAIVLAAITTGLLLGAAAPCLAQATFEVDKIDPPELADVKSPVHREHKTVRTRALANANLTDDDKARAMKWYTGYVLPKMTQVADAGAMGQFRKEMTTDLSKIKNSDLHDQLVSAAEAHTTKVLAGNYTPYAKITAIYLLGSLNSTEASVTQRVPTPYEPALQILLDRVKDPNEMDGLKAAALYGIHRHMATYLSDKRTILPADQQRVTAVLLPLVQMKSPPGKRSIGGHAWLRSRAIDALAAIGTPGANGEVYQAFSDVLAENDAPLTLRCAAADGIGLLQYPDGFSADFGKTAQSLAQVAVAATDREVARFEKIKEDVERKQGSGAGGLGGGIGGSGGLGGPPGGGGSEGPPGGDGDLGLGTGSGGAGLGLGGSGGAGLGLGGSGGAGLGLGGSGGAGLGGSGGLGGGLGGSGSFGPAIPQHKVDNFKRFLHYQLLCCQKGVRGRKGALKGLKGVATEEPHLSVVNEVDTALEEMLTLVTSDQPITTLVSEVKSRVNDLKQLAGDTGGEKDADEKKPATEEPSGDDPLGGKTADDGDMPPDDGDKKP